LFCPDIRSMWSSAAIAASQLSLKTKTAGSIDEAGPASHAAQARAATCGGGSNGVSLFFSFGYATDGLSGGFNAVVDDFARNGLERVARRFGGPIANSILDSASQGEAVVSFAAPPPEWRSCPGAHE
jgi:hypothetical protein